MCMAGCQTTEEESSARGMIEVANRCHTRQLLPKRSSRPKLSDPPSRQDEVRSPNSRGVGEEDDASTGVGRGKLVGLESSFPKCGRRRTSARRFVRRLRERRGGTTLESSFVLTYATGRCCSTWKLSRRRGSSVRARVWRRGGELIWCEVQDGCIAP